MKDARAALRYAKAILNLAKETKAETKYKYFSIQKRTKIKFLFQSQLNLSQASGPFSFPLST